MRENFPAFRQALFNAPLKILLNLLLGIHGVWGSKSRVPYHHNITNVPLMSENQDFDPHEKKKHVEPTKRGIYPDYASSRRSSAKFDMEPEQFLKIDLDVAFRVSPHFLVESVVRNIPVTSCYIQSNVWVGGLFWGHSLRMFATYWHIILYIYIFAYSSTYVKTKNNDNNGNINKFNS